MKYKLSWFFVTFFLISIVFSEVPVFEVVPDTVGIGLQKNYDIIDFVSSDSEQCVLYHLGNPWSTNVTGWLEVRGELSDFFTKNSPESVFVPSGTFRYNSSCCLLPIKICFKFPYVLETTTFNGTIFSAFSQKAKSSLSGTGSSTGSSVAYSLKVNVKPPVQIELNAGQKKCFDFYNHGKECFRAPLIVLSDKIVNLELNTVTGGHSLVLFYKNNLMIVILSFVILIILLMKSEKIKKLIPKIDIKISTRK